MPQVFRRGDSSSPTCSLSMTISHIKVVIHRLVIPVNAESSTGKLPEILICDKNLQQHPKRILAIPSGKGTRS